MLQTLLNRYFRISSVNVLLTIGTLKRNILEQASFEWTLDDIRIEKIISAPIWATIRCPKLQSCAISRKTSTAAVDPRYLKAEVAN